ncbi:MAG: hypothetical protein ACRD0U_07060 [Acidimicrobiales bacterium]
MATLMLEGGADIRYIQAILGHYAGEEVKREHQFVPGGFEGQLPLGAHFGGGAVMHRHAAAF